MKISLVGAGYWGSKLQKELETIDGVEDIEIIDIKNNKINHRLNFYKIEDQKLIEIF